ncbi:MAG: 16S rRNA (cytidine(1402)-2'-O)-methyltransferase [Chitinophagales bacterium]|nr:16S rRNA (cytidine(1402)-2'-O)-methyltransferase [Chitinophagales bacterium]MDW8274362.1 16S rRNA (cytidine(1402)-2'-O)-methyltransferase [Chitinophagales bacterium]
MVPTPIGNLEDITLRALRVLKEVDIIVAEDTRQTRKLLHHYGIEKQLLSHHSFNEHKTVDNIIRLLEGGQQVALVSDSGTPSISDPGFLLVRHCIEAGLTVECLPGPTAFVPALVVSGLPIHEFVFIGFLPHKKGRGSAIKRLAEEQRTVILYESPHRMLKLLEQLLSFAGPERKISVSRELTKKFEQTVRGSIEDVLKHFRHNEPRGEFVVVMEGKRNV